MDTNDKIRNAVRIIAGNNGLTVRELSYRSGINQSTISNFLNEHSGLSIDKADKLLRSLGLEIGVRRIRAREG